MCWRSLSSATIGSTRIRRRKQALYFSYSAQHCIACFLQSSATSSSAAAICCKMHTRRLHSESRKRISTIQSGPMFLISIVVARSPSAIGAVIRLGSKQSSKQTALSLPTDPATSAAARNNRTRGIESLSCQRHPCVVESRAGLCSLRSPRSAKNHREQRAKVHDPSAGADALKCIPFPHFNFGCWSQQIVQMVAQPLTFFAGGSWANHPTADASSGAHSSRHACFSAC